jgi:hypothetical protein
MSSQLQQSHITISLIDFPKAGEARMLMRLNSLDKSLVDRVAAQIGMNQADFMRVACVNTARAIAAALDEQEESPILQGLTPLDLEE